MLQDLIGDRVGRDRVVRRPLGGQRREASHEVLLSRDPVDVGDGVGRQPLVLRGAVVREAPRADVLQRVQAAELLAARHRRVEPRDGVLRRVRDVHRHRADRFSTTPLNVG